MPGNVCTCLRQSSLNLGTWTASCQSLSDDLTDYDVVSDGPRSLESSIADLGHVDGAGMAREPEAMQAAKGKYDTIGLSAEDIQAYVQKCVPSAAAMRRTLDGEVRTVRIYVDGAFDPFLLPRDALQLRQAKLSFPAVHLMVGVFADEVCSQRQSPTCSPHVDRCELVRHCRWVDEIVTDAPWSIDEAFLRARRIDFVAIEEGASVDLTCDRERLRGFDLVKGLRKAIPVRKTNVTISAERPRSPSPYVKSAPGTIKGRPQQLSPPGLDERTEDADTPFEEPKIDIFGTGIGI